MDRLLEATRRAEQHHFWFRGFRSFVKPLIEQALAGVPNPRLLDCGCGTGANMVMLEKFGRAYGFDITWRGLEFAREYRCERLAHASITRIPFTSGSFDLVTAFDVLYALTESAESAALAEMFRVLKPGGGLIINVAALKVLRGSHSVFGAELRRSTRTRLREVLTGTGFDVVRLTYTNFTLLPIMLGVRTAQRVRGLTGATREAADLSIPAAPLNAVLSGLLGLESRALQYVDMPIGSSLLCLARKPVTQPRLPASRTDSNVLETTR
jgi:ubiquinone/menaquinone biosynthesis C-methylase UbiE